MNMIEAITIQCSHRGGNPHCPGCKIYMDREWEKWRRRVDGLPDWRAVEPKERIE